MSSLQNTTLHKALTGKLDITPTPHTIGLPAQGQDSNDGFSRPRIRKPEAQNVIEQCKNPNAPQHIVVVPAQGQYFIGGFPAFRRNMEDYKMLLKEVLNHRLSDDNENGRLLCIKLLGQELSKAAATKNAAGVFWREFGKDLSMPKLNKELLRAIFAQAKHQFPGFTDLLADPNCKTVKALDDVCRTAQGFLSSWQLTKK